MGLCRDAATVINNRNTVVDMDDDLDVLAEPCERFVDTVVNKFIDKMMESRTSCAADIHGRTFPYGLKAFQHLYAVCGIFHPLLAKKGIRPHKCKLSLSPLHYMIV
jgi:hypothetical protein